MPARPFYTGRRTVSSQSYRGEARAFLEAPSLHASPRGVPVWLVVVMVVGAFGVGVWW